MALNERLRNLLEVEQILYSVLPHQNAFTAQEVAETSHIPGDRLAKVIVLKDGEGSHFLAVIPSTRWLDLAAVGLATGRRGITFANEDEISRIFPDCVVGAMPPFGNLYGVSMYVDPCLLTGEEIWFQAGNHHQVVRMSREDYERLERPVRLATCLHRGRLHAEV